MKRECTKIRSSLDGKRAIYVDDTNANALKEYICKEITTIKGTHVVITCELLERKKSTKLTQREINIIEKVAKYEYKIDE